jgi:hypothetical protein
MPKYFFHMRAGTEFVEDTEGVDLPDIAAAHAEAFQAAREMMSEWVLRVGLEKVSTISISCKPPGEHAYVGDGYPGFC